MTNNKQKHCLKSTVWQDIGQIEMTKREQYVINIGNIKTIHY